MRTLLLGTDFTHNSNGDLIPIEINTNVAMENVYLESDDEIFDLSGLSSFISTNSFTKITYLGSMTKLSLKLKELCDNINVEYTFIAVLSGNLTIPNVEDTPEHLIIRSAYDTTAIVDDVYCKSKVNFLNLIKNKSFGSEFAYLDEFDELVNNITTILDNGDNPNFILKSIYPRYDKNLYPKLYKVTNETELNVILSNLNSTNYLTTYHYNPDKLFNDQITVIRSFNLLFPPNLESIYIGSYKKFTDRKNLDASVFSPTTFEIEWEYRDKYITGFKSFPSPKLLDTDEVEMADGTFKTGFGLQVNDIIKTINIYNPYDVDLDDDLENFHITYDEFTTGSTYTSNRVFAKRKIDRLTEYVTINFTDGTDWGDTGSSSYLVLINDEVQFKYAQDLVAGDQVILIDTLQTEFTSILKEVLDVSFTKFIFSGWEISVEVNHIFLTKTGSDTLESYATIEHNVTCSAKRPCAAKTCAGKGQTCLTFTTTFCHCATV